MKSIFIKAAFLFIISIAFVQASDARGGYYGRRHCERERGYYNAPAPQPYYQPYYYAPMPPLPPVWGHPHYRGGYERREHRGRW